MNDIDNNLGVTLPILSKLVSSEKEAQRVIGHVHFKDRADLPDFPDFCLALGFNRKSVGDYIPRVFVVIDDATYLDAISKLNLPAQMLIEKAKRPREDNERKTD